MTTIDNVRSARERNKNITAADIARELGVSRERVRQALVVLEMPTRVDRRRRPGGGEVLNSLRYSIPMTPHTVGAVCELQVCADLLKAGFDVFRSVSPHAKCDLIALYGGKVFRVEVRAARKGICSTHGDYECLAAVNPDGEITYKPTLDNLTKPY